MLMCAQELHRVVRINMFTCRSVGAVFGRQVCAGTRVGPRRGRLGHASGAQMGLIYTDMLAVYKVCAPFSLLGWRCADPVLCLGVQRVH